MCVHVVHRRRLVIRLSSQIQRDATLRRAWSFVTRDRPSVKQRFRHRVMKAVGVQVVRRKRDGGKQGGGGEGRIYCTRAIYRNLGERDEDTDRGSTVNYVFNAWLSRFTNKHPRVRAWRWLAGKQAGWLAAGWLAGWLPVGKLTPDVAHERARERSRRGCSHDERRAEEGPRGRKSALH